MSTEKINEDLTKAELQSLRKHFDPAAFHHWRSSAGECLGAMLGCNRPNIRYFMGNLHTRNRKTLILGAGILTAAIQEVMKKIGGSKAHGNCSREEYHSQIHRERRKPLRRASRPDGVHKLAPYCPPKYRRPGGIRTKRRK
jgi:hypothetical protein